MLSFFPRGVLDETLNLIESVSDVFPSYSSLIFNSLYLFFFSFFPCIHYSNFSIKTFLATVQKRRFIYDKRVDNDLLSSGIENSHTPV